MLLPTTRHYHKNGGVKKPKQDILQNRHVGRKRPNKMIKSLCLKVFFANVRFNENGDNTSSQINNKKRPNKMIKSLCLKVFFAMVKHAERKKFFYISSIVFSHERISK